MNHARTELLSFFPAPIGMIQALTLCHDLFEPGIVAAGGDMRTITQTGAREVNISAG